MRERQSTEKRQKKSRNKIVSLFVKQSIFVCVMSISPSNYPNLNNLLPNLANYSPFCDSKIYVGVGNTILSFGLFGIVPTICGYMSLRLMEESENTQNLIPFSNTLTLPIAAFVVNKISSISVYTLLIGGTIFAAVQYMMDKDHSARVMTYLSKYSLFFCVYVVRSVSFYLSSTLSSRDADTLFAIRTL